MPSATIGRGIMPPAQELTAARSPMPALALPDVAVRHRAALLVLALTALTFLAPHAPTYDPWSWIIWGREIVHLDLSTVDGPSWKPLPVLLTTPFSLFGDLAPELWLFVARAGAIAGVLLVFRLGRRLGGLPAGAAGAAAYAVAPWTVRNAAMGNSEGLLVALALAAVDRHLDGRTRTSFLLALGAALLRPEVWPFVGLYGLWLLWRAPRVRGLVVAGFASLPVLWLAPEWWGSGDPLRAAHRAQNPRSNSPAFADDPVRAVLEQFDGMLTPPFWVGVTALAVALIVSRPGRREVAIAGGLALGAAVWVAEVAVMTSDGFSGNIRYLIMPAAVMWVLAGVGIGWLARAVLGERAVRGSVLAVVVAIVASAYFAWPARETLPVDLDAVEFQAVRSQALSGTVARAGGAQRLLACGDPYTGPFQVPLVAWHLGVHASQVTLEPRRPAVVFRTQSNPGVPPGPGLEGVGGEQAVRTLGVGGGWRIVGACRGNR
jgi:hypothetical protein